MEKEMIIVDISLYLPMRSILRRLTKRRLIYLRIGILKEMLYPNTLLVQENISE